MCIFHFLLILNGLCYNEVFGQLDAAISRPLIQIQQARNRLRTQILQDRAGYFMPQQRSHHGLLMSSSSEAGTNMPADFDSALHATEADVIRGQGERTTYVDGSYTERRLDFDPHHHNSQRSNNGHLPQRGGVPHNLANSPSIPNNLQYTQKLEDLGLDSSNPVNVADNGANGFREANPDPHIHGHKLHSHIHSHIHGHSHGISSGIQQHVPLEVPHPGINLNVNQYATSIISPSNPQQYWHQKKKNQHQPHQNYQHEFGSQSFTSSGSNSFAEFGEAGYSDIKPNHPINNHGFNGHNPSNFQFANINGHNNDFGQSQNVDHHGLNPTGNYQEASVHGTNNLVHQNQQVHGRQNKGQFEGIPLYLSNSKTPILDQENIRNAIDFGQGNVVSFAGDDDQLEGTLNDFFLNDQPQTDQDAFLTQFADPEQVGSSQTELIDHHLNTEHQFNTKDFRDNTYSDLNNMLESGFNGIQDETLGSPNFGARNAGYPLNPSDRARMDILEILDRRSYLQYRPDVKELPYNEKGLQSNTDPTLVHGVEHTYEGREAIPDEKIDHHGHHSHHQYEDAVDFHENVHFPKSTHGHKQFHEIPHHNHHSNQNYQHSKTYHRKAESVFSHPDAHSDQRVEGSPMDQRHETLRPDTQPGNVTKVPHYGNHNHGNEKMSIGREATLRKKGGHAYHDSSHDDSNHGHNKYKGKPYHDYHKYQNNHRPKTYHHRQAEPAHDIHVPVNESGHSEADEELPKSKTVDGKYTVGRDTSPATPILQENHTEGNEEIPGVREASPYKKHVHEHQHYQQDHEKFSPHQEMDHPYVEKQLNNDNIYDKKKSNPYKKIVPNHDPLQQHHDHLVVPHDDIIFPHEMIHGHDTFNKKGSNQFHENHKNFHHSNSYHRQSIPVRSSDLSLVPSLKHPDVVMRDNEKEKQHFPSRVAITDQESVNSPYLLYGIPKREHLGESWNIRKKRSMFHDNAKKHDVMKRAIPVNRLLKDPKLKLDVPKTIENLGTVTRNAFEDEKAPMYHLRNLVGSTKNTILSAMKIPPQQFMVPSQYEIVRSTEMENAQNEHPEDVQAINPDILSRGKFQDHLKHSTKPKSATLSKSSRSESDDDIFGIYSTFQKVGSVLRDSIKSGQDTMTHLGDIAHDAKNIIHTAKHSVPRVIRPYANAPVLLRNRFGAGLPDSKTMIITPRILDTADTRVGSPKRPENNYVKLGHILDAVGLSSPNSPPLDLQKLLVRRTGYPPKLSIVSVNPKVDFNKKNAPLTGDEYDTVSQTLENLKNAKLSVGAKNLKELLEKFKNELDVKSQELKLKSVKIDTPSKNEAVGAKRFTKKEEDDIINTFLQDLFKQNENNDIKLRKALGIKPKKINNGIPQLRKMKTVPQLFSRFQEVQNDTAPEKYDPEAHTVESLPLDQKDDFPIQNNELAESHMPDALSKKVLRKADFQENEPATVKSSPNDNPEKVLLFLPPELIHPFMNRASDNDLKNFLKDNGDEESSEETTTTGKNMVQLKNTNFSNKMDKNEGEAVSQNDTVGTSMIMDENIQRPFLGIATEDAQNELIETYNGNEMFADGIDDEE